MDVYIVSNARVFVCDLYDVDTTNGAKMNELVLVDFISLSNESIRQLRHQSPSPFDVYFSMWSPDRLSFNQTRMIKVSI